MQTTQTHICIVGGGFGGLYTALRLSQLPQANLKITLIDENSHFLFSPLLYEYVTGELEAWEIAPSFTELLSQSPVQFIQAKVKGVDLLAKQINLINGQSLHYDFLVLSTGGTTPISSVVGVREYALPFRTLTDAQRLQEKLKDLLSSNLDKIRVAVVGGGYSGVELACKVADRLAERARVRIIEMGNSIISSSSEFNRQTATKALAKRNIYVDTNTTVESISADTISLLNRGQLDVLPVELVLWTVGTGINELIGPLDLPKTERGLLKVNEFLQVEQEKSIFALGDIVSFPESLPKTAQVAIQQADFCGWNLWATINNKPLLPFRYMALGEMLSLGEDEATISGLGLNLEGPLAYLMRRLVYLYRLPTLKHQSSVAFHWLTRSILQ
jgi:demethylphylloquinone reductase